VTRHRHRVWLDEGGIGKTHGRWDGVEMEGHCGRYYIKEVEVEIDVEIDVDVDVDGAVQLRRPMLKPASTLRLDDDSRDEASLSCCVTCCQTGLCRALHRDHGA
jgi:hypothetical protein